MKWSSATRIGRQAAIVAALQLMTLTLHAAETASTDAAAEAAKPHWEIVRLVFEYREQRQDRGLALQTSGEDRLGLVLRCDAGILFSALSVKPASFREALTSRSRTRDATVEYQIDDGPVRKEKWVAFHRGKLLMPRRIATTKRLYSAAVSGATIRVSRFAKGTVEIDLPPPDDGLFARFLRECQLLEKYDPTR